MASEGSFISLICLGVLIAIMVKRPKFFDVQRPDFRRWKKPSGKRLLKIATVSLVGLAAMLLICNALVGWLLRAGLIPPELYLDQGVNIVFLVWCLSLGPPLEEWIFRRGVLEVFKSWKGPVVGVLVSAVMFGAMHIFGASIIIGFSPLIAGIIFGVVYLKAGLLASTITHLGNNWFWVVVIWWL